MKVPQSGPDITQAEIAAVTAVLQSGMLSLGPRYQEFERCFVERLGVPHALAVSSGTAGLHLGVRALGLKQGEEVITTSFSFVASANCLEFEGVVPRFVDIEERTLNLDLDAVEAAITPRTRAILPVHVFGLPCDMDRIEAIAKRHRLLIIEDSCEALGSRWNGRPAGSFGDVAVFAFYPNKQITTGEGGMVLVRDAGVAGLIDSMRNQGRADDGGWLRHERLGYNYRLDEMSAALGVVQMQRLDELLAKRAAVAARYEQMLAGVEAVETPRSAAGADVAWFVYVVRLREGLDRDAVMRQLEQRGVQCRPYFPPIHLQPYYAQKYGYRAGQFAVTERMARRTLSIPFFARLGEAEQAYVCEQLAAVCREVSTVGS